MKILNLILNLIKIYVKYGNLNVVDIEYTTDYHKAILYNLKPNVIRHPTKPGKYLLTFD